MAQRASSMHLQEPQRQRVFSAPGCSGVRDSGPDPRWLIRALWKHKVWLAACWLLVTALSWVWVCSLSPVYQAETVILVESFRAPDTVSASRANWEERLNAAGWRVLSSSRLPGLVRELHLSPRRGETPLEASQRIRESVRITPAPERGPDRSPVFRVACQQTDPAVAALVANRLSHLLIQEVRRARQSEAMSASEFLGSQLAGARMELEQQEKALSDFRQRYYGELPEQESTLVAALSRLQAQSASALEAIGRTEQKKILLASALEATRLSAALTAQLAEQSARVWPAAGDGPGTGKVSSRTEQLQNRLTSLRVLYTEDYPDVQRLRSELARVEEMGQGETNGTSANGGLSKHAAAAGGPLEPPVAPSVLRERERVDSLRSQLLLTQGEVESLHARRGRLAAEIDALRRAIGRLPVRQREFAPVLREYEMANGNYRSVANKRLSAETAAEMERRQMTERLSVVEEARIPSRPIRPARWQLGALGSLAGLLLGVAISAVRAVDRKTLREALGIGNAQWTVWAGSRGRMGSARRRAPGGLRRYTSA